MEENQSNTTTGGKVAVCLLTCGRAELTRRTWENNLNNAGHPFGLFWFDNGTPQEELADMIKLSQRFDIGWFEWSEENKGIAHALNAMLKQAFARGYDYVITMGNDILEPPGWVKMRVEAAQTIPNTGLVSIPIQQERTRYRKQRHGHIQYEVGQLTGNHLYTRLAFEKVGLNCTEYGIYGPLDLDYCDRCAAAGLLTYYLAGVKMADHIGKTKDNPAEYQHAKNRSLDKSWPLYKANKARYQRGEKVYQFE